MSMPELGSKISLISKADIRYEGKLFTVDPQECTIALSHVQSFGTEDRLTEFKVPAQSQIYNYILFRGSDIKDIKVITPQIPLNDPAIVQLSVPPNTMGGYNSNYQPTMDDLNSASQVGNSYNPMSGVNLNAGTSHKPSSESSLILDQQQVNQQSQQRPAQTDVLDLISGGSRSSTPAQPTFNGQRNSPTFDQSVQTGQQPSPGNNRNGRNQRNRSTSSDTRKPVRQQGQNYQRNDQHYQRNDQHYQRNDFQHQDNFVNRQGGNRNMNGRNWNNQQNQQQVRRQGVIPNSTGRSFYNNRSTGLPAPSKAQGLRTNSLKFDEDYDFDKANSEFQEIIKKLSRTKIDDGTEEQTEEVTVVNGSECSVNGDTALHSNDSEHLTGKKLNRVDSVPEGAITENDDDDQKIFYDKTKSFFDQISCEAVERSKGHNQRTDWRQERKLNSETFGVAMARRGQYRGRGGYYNNNPNYRQNPNTYNNSNYNNRQGMNYNFRPNNGYVRNNPGSRGYNNYRPRQTNKQDQRQTNAVSPQRVVVA
ncbi:protein LSM14 homolog A isoform X2 [Daktulosphaira vitifoliae]|uniref:protein LSM14 homolog A isoform X2 n=1 Tax=Daktulosphaira vitifoliae TaxID=58002 RepID=UPI0021A9D5D9|nr:protein LSM14 homolog A isoform X2 [Daktulosphaira vitifoliae]